MFTFSGSRESVEVVWVSLIPSPFPLSSLWLHSVGRPGNEATQYFVRLCESVRSYDPLCYPVQVMFNGQRLCLYNLTLHVLRSQFFLQQFDLQREKEMKIKSKLNVSKSTVMCLRWLRKTPVNLGVVSVQVKREEVNNVLTDPPLSRMMANTCTANIQCTSQTPSHTVFLEPQGISLIPRPPSFLPFVCIYNNTQERKTSEKR